MATPMTSTTAMGYIISPPPWKNRTIVPKEFIIRLPCLNQSIKLVCLANVDCDLLLIPAGRGCGFWRRSRDRRRLGLQRRKVAVLTPEHITIDRCQHLIEEAVGRSAGEFTQVGPFPRHHEHLAGQFLVPSDLRRIQLQPVLCLAAATSRSRIGA